MFARIVIVLCAAVSLLVVPGFAETEQESLETLQAIYQKAEDLVESGRYREAAAEARGLMKSGPLQEGDFARAGMVRALSDALATRGEKALADELLASSRSGSPPRGDVALVLQGRSLQPWLDLKSRFGFSARAMTFIPALGRDFQTNVDLDRIKVGHQAGILKIWGPSGYSQVMFWKDIPGTDIRGIDGRLWAPLADHHRAQIKGALGITSPDGTVRSLIRSYPSSPQKLQTIALLGALGSEPGSSLTESSRGEILRFLMDQMDRGEHVALRRQALLSLALVDQISPEAVERVVDFYDRTSNVWEAFPVVQFFEYHSPYISALPNSRAIRDRLESLDSLYTPYVIEHIRPN